MTPIRIDDPGDPRIAAYRDIKERDLKGRHGLFVAEGKVVLNVLFAAGRFAVESVLILENRMDGMRSALAGLDPDIPVYVANADVLDQTAGFHVHRGILAIGRRRVQASLAAELANLPQKNALVLALIGISDHDNMGAIFRNAAAFGVDAVLMDATCCDPLYRKAIRVSVGAALKVPFAFAANEGELMETLAANAFDRIALSSSGAVEIGEVDVSDRTALFLGTEGAGLSRDVLERMPTVRIGMAEGFDSLNVAAASAIALHHFARAGGRLAQPIIAPRGA